MKEIHQHIYSSEELNTSQIPSDRLLKAMSKLPVENCLAIKLHFIDKQSRKDIAQLLGWPLSRVNTKITRGISLLKRELTDPAFTINASNN